MSTCQQRMLITACHGRAVVPHVTRVVTVEDAIAPCPECGNADVETWADDGESDSADWWECTRCGFSGAFLHVDPSRSTTPNGLEVTP